MTMPYKKVLANTYLFTSFGVVLAALSSVIGNTLNVISSMTGFIATFVVAIVLLIVAFKKAETTTGFVLGAAFFATMGLMIGPAVGAASLGTVVSAIAITSLIFVVLSAYALCSKKDFSFMGGFLFVALIALVLTSVLNIFIQNSFLHVALSYIAILIFSGYILYDTSNIVNGYETSYVRASLNMFMNIINIFTSLLNVLED